MKTRAEIENELSILIASKLESSIRDKGYATLVVSGGSTPIELFKKLSEIEICWDKVNITLADERFVPDTNMDQNGNLIKEYLLQNKASKAKFYPLVLDAKNAENNLQEVKYSIAEIPSTFTVVILGMGIDGHTASLFPCSKELIHGMDLNNESRLIITYPISAPYQRITFTRKALLNTENLFLHIYGNEKKKILEELDNTKFEKHPIKAFINQPNVKTEIFWSN